MAVLVTDQPSPAAISAYVIPAEPDGAQDRAQQVEVLRRVRVARLGHVALRDQHHDESESGRLMRKTQRQPGPATR